MLDQDGYFNNRLAGARFDINGRSPTATAEYFKYDASGNVWYDRHAKTSYKLNAAGLPEVAYIQNEYDADLTLSAVNSGSVDDLSATMYMTYDETGSRVWTRVQTADMDYGEATLPGVGVYSSDLQAQTGYALKRMDLVAGGYRDVSTGKAYFPVTDAQGNVRGYADDEGLVSAYDYYAYGGVKALTVNSTIDDNKRWVFIRETLMQLKWRSFIEKDILRRSGCEAAFLIRSNRDSAQGKEYDEPIQKHYFGARYFDPFFGMWMSPDPAHQFSNPYTYGGDPLNYVDPNGEWIHIVLGAVIGAVVGTVNGAIQCSSSGGGSCGKAIGVGFVGGAAVGAGAAATGGLVAEAVGGGLAGGIAGGAAGGAVGGAGNYVNQSIANGGFNSGDLWNATWKGAVSGAVGGAAGDYFGNLRGVLVGGFSGGAVGSALNKEDGWNILKSGIMGAAMGAISYSASVHVKAKASYEQYEDQEPIKYFSKEALDEIYDRQLAISDKDGLFWKKQEFSIIKYPEGEMIVANRYDPIEDVTKVSVPKEEPDVKLIHTHDIRSEYRTASPGDIETMKKNIFGKNFQAFVLDTKTSIISEYDHLGTKNTYKYDRNYSRNAYYKNFWSNNFLW